jgi:hypothetical protein
MRTYLSHFSTITDGIKAFAVTGNKLLYACVKEACRLWAQRRLDTFHQLLIIAEVLWFQPVLQVSKQVIVARSEIRTVRWVLKQLLVELLQQCSSASNCTQARIVMEAHCTFHAFRSEWRGAVIYVFRNTLLTLLWSLVAWIPPSALLSCPRKQSPSTSWQADNVWLNFWLIC